MDNLLRLGFIKGEVPADGFCICDGPSHVVLLVAAYHRNDVGSIIIRIGVGMATNAVDLLDVAHPLRLVRCDPSGLINGWRRSLHHWSSGQWSDSVSSSMAL